MSCSARLPVYLLLIDAFIPPVTYLGGLISLQGIGAVGNVVGGSAGGDPGRLAHEEDDFPQRNAPLCDGTADVQVPVAARGRAPRLRSGQGLRDAGRHADFRDGDRRLVRRLLSRRPSRIQQRLAQIQAERQSGQATIRPRQPN